jgi:hypothetical protein
MINSRWLQNRTDYVATNSYCNSKAQMSLPRCEYAFKSHRDQLRAIELLIEDCYTHSTGVVVGADSPAYYQQDNEQHAEEQDSAERTRVSQSAYYILVDAIHSSSVIAY